MPGKRHTPNKSLAQQRKKFVLAEQGKMSMEDAKGSARASRGKNLPMHVKKGKKKFRMAVHGGY